jgi:hypothetical protein
VILTGGLTRKVSERKCRKRLIGRDARVGFRINDRGAAGRSFDQVVRIDLLGFAEEPREVGEVKKEDR